MEINKKIKELRKSKKITQDWLSYELGISQEAYSKLENGISNLSFQQVEKICSIFKVSLYDLNNNILIKNNKNIMKNTLEKIFIDYQKYNNDKNKIVSKWKPVLERYGIKDEYMLEWLPLYCEKHSLYENVIKEDNNLDSISFDSLPIDIKILSLINDKNKIVFDEFDNKTIKQEIIECYFNLIENLDTNKGIEAVSNLEIEAINRSKTFLESILHTNNKLYLQTPLIEKIIIINSDDITKLKIVINYAI